MLASETSASLARVVQPFTMVGTVGLTFAMERVVAAIEDDVPGDIVECGVWKGGCSLAMVLAQRDGLGEVVRPVHMLDGFTGLPPATSRDGNAALAWQRATESPYYFGNCCADRGEVEFTFWQFRCREKDYRIWAGNFAETLPQFAATGPRIAILRIDCDWYDSVRPCLDHLVPMVSPGGTVIIDDYFAWDGCARAVHDYLSANDLPYRVKSLPDFSAAYFEVTGAAGKSVGVEITE